MLPSQIERDECDICSSVFVKEYHYKCAEGHIIRRFYCDECASTHGKNPPALCVKCHSIGDDVDMFDVKPVDLDTLETKVFEAVATVQERDNGCLFVEVDVPMIAGIIADVLKVGFETGEKVKVIIVSDE